MAAQHAATLIPNKADHEPPRGLPPTITVEQAGELLGISRRSAYRAASAGQLPTFKVGRRLLVPTARLLDLLGLSADSLGSIQVASRS